MLLVVDKGFVTEPEDELAPVEDALIAVSLGAIEETEPLWALDD